MADFVELRRTGDPALRDHIVGATVGLARWVARRFAGRGEELDDLDQVALLALVKAVDSFDPEYGCSFATFAVAKILGELKRHFRDHAWVIRPPRAVHNRALELAGLTESLTHELHRSPTPGELAYRSGYSERLVREAMNTLVACRSCTDGTVGFSSDVDAPADDPGLEDTENRVTVAQLLDHLPARDRELVRLRFYGEHSQANIARHLGVSQMHVSRRLARTLADLRRISGVDTPAEMRRVGQVTGSSTTTGTSR